MATEVVKNKARSGVGKMDSEPRDNSLKIKGESSKCVGGGDCRKKREHGVDLRARGSDLLWEVQVGRKMEEHPRRKVRRMDLRRFD